MAHTPPRTWVAGEWPTAAQFNANIRDNQNAAFPLGVDAWTAYTPTWTGTLGNGARVGRYQRIGRLIHFYISLRWGSTTSHGAATQTFTVPVASIANSFFSPVGVAVCENAGVGLFTRTALLVTGSATVLQVNLDNAAITDAVPFTWANGDGIVIRGSYEAAS